MEFQLPPDRPVRDPWGALAQSVGSRALLGKDVTEVLRQVLVQAGAEDSAAIAKEILKVALPPKPTRAEVWWEENRTRIEIPEGATLADIGQWLMKLVSRGVCPPPVATELLSHFRAIQLVGGMGAKRRSGPPDLRAVK